MINKISKVPVSKLSRTQLETLIPRSWNLVDNSIQKSFKFKNFEETWAFLNQVSMRSHLWGHHPEIKTVYNQAQITLTTHDVQGISDADIKLAKKIDSYWKIYSPDSLE